MSDSVASADTSDKLKALSEQRAGLRCQCCGKLLAARRATARYCNATCRSQAWAGPECCLRAQRHRQDVLSPAGRAGPTAQLRFNHVQHPRLQRTKSGVLIGFRTMTKDSLAAQLRHGGICRGDFSMINMEDDEVLKKYAGPYVTEETLSRFDRA